jgi:hypothetical protein
VRTQQTLARIRRAVVQSGGAGERAGAVRSRTERCPVGHCRSQRQRAVRCAVVRPMGAVTGQRCSAVSKCGAVVTNTRKSGAVQQRKCGAGNRPTIHRQFHRHSGQTEANALGAAHDKGERAAADGSDGVSDGQTGRQQWPARQHPSDGSVSRAGRRRPIVRCRVRC